MDKSSIHYKILHFDNLPLSFRRFLIIVINWFFQGVLYMDKTEQLFKLSFSLVLSIFLFIFFLDSYSPTFSIFFSLFLAHTLNWVFNGQIFVLLKNLGVTTTSPDHFNNYLCSLKDRCSKERSIVAAAAFGSLSREELKLSSDLDVRLIRSPGAINGLRACLFLLFEHSRAFFNRFPLDIYILDHIDTLDIHIKNEKPIIIYDPLSFFKKGDFF